MPLCEVDTYRRRVSMQKDEQSVNGYLDYILPHFSFLLLTSTSPNTRQSGAAILKLFIPTHHTKKSPPKRHTDKIQKQVGTTNF